MGVVDEFQPNLAVSANGTVSVNFYDRRLACPASPFGATNYCIDTSIQFYRPNLMPKSHNIRLSLHSWDPQLNSPFRFCVCSPGATFIGDYFGNTFAGSTSFTTSISTYDDGTNRATTSSRSWPESRSRKPRFASRGSHRLGSPVLTALEVCVHAPEPAAETIPDALRRLRGC